jgi:hypothetical protein
MTMRAVQVAPDGRRLGSLVQLRAQGLLTVSVEGMFPLERASADSGDRVGRGMPGEDGENGQRCTGAPVTADAADFPLFPGPGHATIARVSVISIPAEVSGMDRLA